MAARLDMNTAPCFICGMPADAAVVGLDVDPTLVIRAAPFCEQHELEAAVMAEEGWSGPQHDVQVLYVNVADLSGVLDEMTGIFGTSAWVLTTAPE